jgi:hypothetical protein
MLSASRLRSLTDLMEILHRSIRPFADALEATLRVIAERRSTLCIASALLPVLAIVLFPSGFAENESQYLMLAHRHVAPEAFSEYSAAFDHTNARFATQWLMGGLVHAIGYEGAQVVLRVLTMVLYAGSVAWFFSGLGLSVLESVLGFAIYEMIGPALIGAEWLFRGVEAKTLPTLPSSSPSAFSGAVGRGPPSPRWRSPLTCTSWSAGSGSAGCCC